MDLLIIPIITIIILIWSNTGFNAPYKLFRFYDILQMTTHYGINVYYKNNQSVLTIQYEKITSLDQGEIIHMSSNNNIERQRILTNSAYSSDNQGKILP